MQATVVPGVSMWSVWQSERGLFFNAFFLERPEGNVAIDPLPLDATDEAQIVARGGVGWIVVTNRDHERGARDLARRFDAKLATSVREAPLLAGPVDRLLDAGDEIAGGTVVALAGLKTPGEFALHFPALDAALVGDAVWGNPAGSLRLMPDDKLADPNAAVRSLRALAALRFEHLLVGDGACIFGGARAALWKALVARGEAYVNAINADQLVWRTKAVPPGFAGVAIAEIGDVIGAQKLGYRLARVPPGAAFAPLHWHAGEEELFVVMRGNPTLVTPRGRVALRAGDYVAFATGPEGAHKLINESNETCEVFMIANVDAHDVCVYPDSHKLLVEATGGHMLRDAPQLDYYDGELATR